MPAICSSLKLSPTLLITAVGGAGTRISEHVQQQQYGATRPSVEDDRARQMALWLHIAAAAHAIWSHKAICGGRSC